MQSVVKWCFKYFYIYEIQMWKIWNPINHPSLMSSLHLVSEKMHKYITHGSKQISEDYRVAYFLNSDRSECGSQSAQVGERAREIHKAETPPADSLSRHLGICLFLAHLNMCCRDTSLTWGAACEELICVNCVSRTVISIYQFSSLEKERIYSCGISFS